MFRNFVQDVVGFVLLVQAAEVVLCTFTRVMSLRGSVGTTRTAEVTSLNRRDMLQSHHLVSLSGAARKRRRSRVASRFRTSFRRSAETAAQPGGFKIPDSEL